MGKGFVLHLVTVSSGNDPVYCESVHPQILSLLHTNCVSTRSQERQGKTSCYFYVTEKTGEKLVWNEFLSESVVMSTAGSTKDITIHLRIMFLFQANSLYFYVTGKTGKYYCGMKVLSCACCDGHCGPNNGCNCPPCAALDKEEQDRLTLVEEQSKPSGPMIDSWTWGQQPGGFTVFTFSKMVY